MIVIGGGISKAADELLYEPIRREIRLRALEVPARAVQVVRAKLGNRAGLVGAAALAMRAAGVELSA
ncbi:MAG: hypothetical protein KatS3mg115_0795 [Candidatus Poribacteria bacterium]|nr:MAG: hypothetical protein KatS3mg115_0795 [Candidatus Poribacteria bacterium]